MNPGAESRTAYPDFEAARRRAVRGLRGRTLEIGAGRGANFADLDPAVDWVGLEPRPGARGPLARAAREAGFPGAVLTARAEDIPLPDHGVDNVLATRVLCSVDDLERALAEIARVLRPGGRLIAAEHVAAPAGSGAARLQRVLRPLTRRFQHGCDPTRDIARAIRESALVMVRVEEFALPVLGGLSLPALLIEARRDG